MPGSKQNPIERPNECLENRLVVKNCRKIKNADKRRRMWRRYGQLDCGHWPIMRGPLDHTLSGHNLASLVGFNFWMLISYHHIVQLMLRRYGRTVATDLSWRVPLTTPFLVTWHNLASSGGYNEIVIFGCWFVYYIIHFMFQVTWIRFGS